VYSTFNTKVAKLLKFDSKNSWEDYRVNKKRREKKGVRSLNKEIDNQSMFKKRLIRIQDQTKVYTIFHKLSFTRCGYCGKKIDIFAPRVLQDNAKNITFYYGCKVKCENSTYHRAVFIDKLLIQFLQKRLIENIPAPKSEGDLSGLLDMSSKLEKLQSNRKELLMKMHYASYKRDNVLSEIKDVKNEILSLEEEISKYFTSKIDENPLLYPIFNTPSEQVLSLNMFYLRELVKLLVNRLRLFNDFLTLRLKPLNEQELSKDDGFGKLRNVNLRISDRIRHAELPDPDSLTTPEYLEEIKMFDGIEINDEEDLVFPNE